jgi:hypothetical protein
VGLKKLDDATIDKAEQLKNLSDEELRDYLTYRLDIIANRPKEFKQVDKAVRIFSKTASFAKPGKVIKALKYFAVPIGIVAGGVYLSNKLQPERWEPMDPETAYKQLKAQKVIKF